MSGGTTATNPTAVDRHYDALTDPVSRADLREFKRRLKSTPLRSVGWKARSTSISAIILVPTLTLLIEVLIDVTIGFVIGTWELGQFGLVLDIMDFAIVFAIGVVVDYLILRREARITRPLRTWFKLDRFGRANEWYYQPTVNAPLHSGCIFNLGRERVASDIFRMGKGGAVEIGNYRFIDTSYGRAGSRRQWGYIRLRLGRPLPHMVLVARTGRRWSLNRGLPVNFRGSQTLSLEGDFDKYFTLYAPHQYQRDALYVFTPDLMALLIDEAHRFDVEIVDNYMYIYSPVPFNLLSPATYEGLDRFVSTVGRKTWTQTVRYADDRAGVFAGRMVAPQGRRLVRNVSVASIIVAVLWILLHLLGPITQAMSSR